MCRRDLILCEEVARAGFPEDITFILRVQRELCFRQRKKQ